MLNESEPQLTNQETEKPILYITWGGGGHESEYVIDFSNYNLNKFIPNDMANEIQAKLNERGNGWTVTNRGSRLEIVLYDEEKMKLVRNDEVVLDVIEEIFKDKYELELV